MEIRCATNLTVPVKMQIYNSFCFKFFSALKFIDFAILEIYQTIFLQIAGSIMKIQSSSNTFGTPNEVFIVKISCIPTWKIIFSRGFSTHFYVLHLKKLKISDGSGSVFCGLGWVSHLWFGFEFQKFPLKRQIFQFFPFRSKKSLWVGLESTRVEGGSAS